MQHTNIRRVDSGPGFERLSSNAAAIASIPGTSQVIAPDPDCEAGPSEQIDDADKQHEQARHRPEPRALNEFRRCSHRGRVHHQLAGVRRTLDREQPQIIAPHPSAHRLQQTDVVVGIAAGADLGNGAI